MTQTKIEWADRSDWNPVRGCTRVNEACRNCYAEIMAARFSKPGHWGEGFAHIVDTPQGKDHRWTGKVELQEDRLRIPFSWRKPCRAFANSTSDFFHIDLPGPAIDQLFAVMGLTSHITWIVLTKRPDLMRAYFANPEWKDRVLAHAEQLKPGQAWNGNFWQMDYDLKDFGYLRNIHLGTSVHDQASADEFLPDLLSTPAAAHIASYEPALGPIDWTRIAFTRDTEQAKEVYGLPGDKVTALTSFWNALDGTFTACEEEDGSIDLRPHGARHIDFPYSLAQIIAGGESGPGARPAHPDWFRQTRDQCAAAGTAFFFKQWGSCLPGDMEGEDEFGNPAYEIEDCAQPVDYDVLGRGRHLQAHAQDFIRFSHKKCGNHLDGKQHLELPGAPCAS